MLVQVWLCAGRPPPHSASSTVEPSLRWHHTVRVCTPTEHAPALQPPKLDVRHVYVGVVQAFVVASQVPLWQSLPVAHPSPATHRGHVPPPQSTPVSGAVRTPSSHVGGMHEPFTHTLPALQAVSAVQPAAHPSSSAHTYAPQLVVAPCTQAPSPSQCGAGIACPSSHADTPHVTSSPTGAQVPRCAGRSHRTHAPSHAVSQHTPLAQVPLSHAAPSAQLAPSGNGGGASMLASSASTAASRDDSTSPHAATTTSTATENE